MKVDGEQISAPEFPEDVEWINAAFFRVGTLLGQHAVLVWFWDYTSLNSLRAASYVIEWDRRYRDHGLKVAGVHSPQFAFGTRIENVEQAVHRLGMSFAVAHDRDFTIWKLYGNEVWPSLYLWDRRGILRYVHYAEGAYLETERAIGKLLRQIDDGLDLPAPVRPLRDTDVPGAAVVAPTPHTYLNEDRSARPVRAGDELSIRFAGAAAAAVLEGTGKVDVVIDREPISTVDLEGPQLYELADFGRHGQHDLTLRFRNDALAYAFSFAPGLAGTEG